MNRNIEKVCEIKDLEKRFKAIDFLLEKGYVTLDELCLYFIKLDGGIEFYNKYKDRGINLDRVIDVAISNDYFNYLIKLATIPGVNIKKIEDFFVERKYYYGLVKIAKHPNANIKRIERILLADIFKSETAYLDNCEYIAEFVKIPGANTKKIINAFLSKWEQFPKGYCNINYSNVLIKLAEVADKKDLKALTKIILESEDSFQICRLFDVSGTNKALVENALIKRKEFRILTDLAAKKEEVNVSKLERVIIRFGSTLDVIDFAISVPTANIELIEQELLKRCDALIKLEMKIEDYLKFHPEDYKVINWLLGVKRLIEKRDKHVEIYSYILNIDTPSELSQEELDELFLDESQKLVRKQKNGQNN